MIRLGGQYIGLFLGLSTETKPTAANNSSSFYLETDTGKVFAVVTGAWTDSVATPIAALTKSSVGLGNVDNTSDAAKPVSTATQTALDAKQATLVSGTNIKTINGSSVLGAGDLVVSGTTNIKQTEVDFGTAAYQTEKSFTVTDADVSAGSQILGSVRHVAPSDARSVDEIAWESFDLFFKSGAGSFDLLMKSRLGTVSGKYVIAYLVG